MPKVGMNLFTLSAKPEIKIKINIGIKHTTIHFIKLPWLIK